MAPSHLAKFTFAGVVKNDAGKPIPDAWVKVRGWEALTGPDGKWKQEQVIDCGTLREHADHFDESDAILIGASGYESFEEKFVVKHPGYFQSCDPEQTLLFDTVLTSESPEKAENRAAAKVKPPRESPAIPTPNPNRKKGKYSL